MEKEIRELKDILNEKDEKIDMLVRIRSHSTTSIRPKGMGNTMSQSTIVESTKDDKGESDEVFKVAQSPTFVGDQSGTSYFMGTSSSRYLIRE
jgi:hypothetical protein